MKLKNVLIVVKDNQQALKFYHDLFGLELIVDNDGNMILTEGLVLQEEKYWKAFLGREIVPEIVPFSMSSISISYSLSMYSSMFRSHESYMTLMPVTSLSSRAKRQWI